MTSGSRVCEATLRRFLPPGRRVRRGGGRGNSARNSGAFPQGELENDRDARRTFHPIKGGPPRRGAPHFGNARQFFRNGTLFSWDPISASVNERLGPWRNLLLWSPRLPRLRSCKRRPCPRPRGRGDLIAAEFCAGRESHRLPAGAIRRSSSKKFWIKTTLSRLASASSPEVFSTATRSPSGCRS